MNPRWDWILTYDRGKTGADGGYWLKIFSSPQARKRRMCVIQHDDDGLFYISGSDIDYPKPLDVGPYETAEEAMVAAETMVLLDEIPQPIKERA